jgi:hypothetical protein
MQSDRLFAPISLIKFFLYSNYYSNKIKIYIVQKKDVFIL